MVGHELQTKATRRPSAQRPQTTSEQQRAGVFPAHISHRNAAITLTNGVAIANEAVVAVVPKAPMASRSSPQRFSTNSPSASLAKSPCRGRRPNIAWRSVSMQQLRAHPFFCCLPPPSQVLPSTAADLRLFRQDSRQWAAIHSGRISTSACASCLGLYEERSGRVLGVPVSLRGHFKALDAHARLVAPLLDDLSALHPDMWREHDEEDGGVMRGAESSATWRPLSHAETNIFPPFLCAFHPSEPQTSRGSASASISHTRMQWGTMQEPTSILAAVNYFGLRNAVVEEAGLQPLEALPACELSKLPQGLPPLGASPDAIVRWPDGTVEPLEVKNHSPFASTPRHARAAGAPPLEVRDVGPYDGIAVWHLPQLYLHMLCMGEKCSSALFMSSSATRGSNIFRLRRDATVMSSMLLFIARFNAMHGNGSPPPAPNFMSGVAGYSQFLDRLKRACREHVELVAHIPDEDVQRGQDGRFFTD